MSPTIVIAVVVGLVVIASLAYFFLFRGKDNALVPTEDRERELPHVREKPQEKAKSSERVAEKPEKKTEAASPKERAGAAPVPEAPRGERPEKKAEVSVDVIVEDGGAKQAAPPSAKAPLKKDVAGLRKGLAATRGGLHRAAHRSFQGKKEIDPAILEQMEEVMLSSDVGPKTTQAILERLREARQERAPRRGRRVGALCAPRRRASCPSAAGRIRVGRRSRPWCSWWA